jgi:hypothetical protein
MCGLATPALLLKFLLYPQKKFNKITVYKPVKATVTPGVTKVENNTPLQKKKVINASDAMKNGFQDTRCNAR